MTTNRMIDSPDRSDLAKYIKKAFSAIMIGENYGTLNAILVEYSNKLLCSPGTIRNWMIGRQRPNEEQIRVIAQDAVRRGELSGNWLRNFLKAAGANEATIEEIRRELFPG